MYPEVLSQKLTQSTSVTDKALSRNDMHLDDASSDSIFKIKIQPANKNYETDVQSAMQYTRWLLQLLGVWSIVSKNPSKTGQFFSVPIMVMCLVAMSFTLIPTILHMIVREKNPLKKLMMFGPIGACLASILKYTMIVSSCRTIKLCMEHMETDWRTIESANERAIMTRNARVGRGLTVTCGLFMYAGGMAYHLIMPMTKGSKINQLNETIRPLVYPGLDIFFEVQKSPTYEIVFCGACVSGFVRYTVTIAGCSLAAVFVSHACGQIQIVMSRLENLFEGIDDTRNNDELQERIFSVIRCHVRGLGLSSKIDEALRVVCLIEVVAVTLLICLLEYYCMMEWDNSVTVAIMTYFVLLISYVFNIFIICHIGELLKEQCEQIGKSTYMIEWYRLSGKTGLALVMIMAMANYPRKLTAGRMMELSLRSFGIIMKTSVMYLNMLRAMSV